MKPNASPYSPTPETKERMTAERRNPPKYVWADVYPELVNKVRWAICTSLKTRASNYPYTLGQALATVLSGFAIDIAKQEIESPGSTQSTSLIRALLSQWKADDQT